MRLPSSFILFDRSSGSRLTMKTSSSPGSTIHPILRSAYRPVRSCSRPPTIAPGFPERSLPENRQDGWTGLTVLIGLLEFIRLNPSALKPARDSSRQLTWS